MRTLAKNIINIWGDRGETWIKNLPLTIQSLSEKWSLTDVTPVDNMTHNYVAKAFQNRNTPVVLKISCDSQLIANEYKALKHFNGHRAIKLLDFNADYDALLLEQAIPGCTLKDYYPLNDDETVKSYAQVAKALATPSQSLSDCMHVSQWCKTIDRITSQRIGKCFLDKAKELRSKLLSSAQNEYLCHGDLHLENIIKQGTSWIAIDPKGVIGEMAFEVAAFDLTHQEDMQGEGLLPAIIRDRVTILSQALQLDPKRLLAWIFFKNHHFGPMVYRR